MAVLIRQSAERGGVWSKTQIDEVAREHPLPPARPNGVNNNASTASSSQPPGRRPPHVVLPGRLPVAYARTGEQMMDMKTVMRQPVTWVAIGCVHARCRLLANVPSGACGEPRTQGRAIANRAVTRCRLFVSLGLTFLRWMLQEVAMLFRRNRGRMEKKRK